MKIRNVFKKAKAKLKRSKLYSLNKRDLVNGILMAGLSSILYFVQESADKKELSLDWKGIGMAAVSGVIGYLIKNFFTPENNIIQDEK